MLVALLYPWRYDSISADFGHLTFIVTSSIVFIVTPVKSEKKNQLNLNVILIFNVRKISRFANFIPIASIFGFALLDFKDFS